MNTITTVDRLRRRLGLSTTTEDVQLREALEAATRQMERLAGRRFTPRQAVIAHDVLPQEPSHLLLRDDLLALTSLTDAGGAIPLNEALVLPGGDCLGAVIELVGGRTFRWTQTPRQAISVGGVWGWHDRPSQMWRGSGDTVRSNPFSSSATTLNVTDASAADSEGEAPRFQVGQLLKIEDEYLRVLAVSIVAGADDVLTLQRGVNGTTAAAHAQGVAIAVYQPPADVEQLALAWAGWLYRQPDFAPSEPTPPDLLRMLAPLRRV
ncbi:MAG: hypothetical protein SF029_15080 [bacterium]|nr:hypothetical protein [bacterium]